MVVALSLVLCTEVDVGIIVAGHCNGNTGAHVQVGWQLDLAGEVPVDDSIRVSRPVVESVWLEQSSSPGCRPRECRLSLPGSVWLERSSSPGCSPHTGQLSLPGSVCSRSRHSVSAPEELPTLGTLLSTQFAILKVSYRPLANIQSRSRLLDR